MNLDGYPSHTHTFLVLSGWIFQLQEFFNLMVVLCGIYKELLFHTYTFYFSICISLSAWEYDQKTLFTSRIVVSRTLASSLYQNESLNKYAQNLVLSILYSKWSCIQSTFNILNLFAHIRNISVYGICPLFKFSPVLWH